LKAFPPEKDRSKLEAKRTVQKSLTDQYCQLTIPVTEVFPFGSGLGVLDQYKEAPKAMETLTHHAVVAYARNLVEFVQRASSLQKTL
jgi:hypothetical protein